MFTTDGHAVALHRAARGRTPAVGAELIERTRREWYEIHRGVKVDTEKFRVASTCGIRNCVSLEHARVVPKVSTLKQRKLRRQSTPTPRVPRATKGSRAEQKARAREWVRSHDCCAHTAR